MGYSLIMKSLFLLEKNHEIIIFFWLIRDVIWTDSFIFNVAVSTNFFMHADFGGIKSWILSSFFFWVAS